MTYRGGEQELALFEVKRPLRCPLLMKNGDNSVVVL